MKLVNVWESYERNGDSFAMFKTKEQALNHDLFEVDRVIQAQVWLTQSAEDNLKKDLPVW